MNKRVADACICCDNTAIGSSPAILMPFLAHRIFNWRPFEITADLDLERYGIKTGMAYQVCNSLFCLECYHLFLDIRFNDDEMSHLYSDYREDEYVALRDHYEPGYKIKNEQLNSGYNYVTKIDEFLCQYLDTASGINILDWGGDTGKNTPLQNQCHALHIYDISERPLQGKAKSVTKKEMYTVSYDLIVCSNVLEHVPFPRDILGEIKVFMNADSILYIELPYENLIRKADEMGDLKSIYKAKQHWHEHINFFNKNSIEKMLTTSGYKIIELRKLNISGETADYVFQVACKIN
jgi:2-polyprenyl-3-methyl-5-hydroxy-6-metoxy-1,4-benzoquinol methylase